MRLIVCYGSFGDSWGHPCGVAHKALTDAGHDPDVQRAYGWRYLPDALNVMPGRKEAKRRTGSVDVPVLILDDDQTVAGTQAIVAWARANPAGQAGAPSPKPAA
jgi:hypothetical protein